MSEHTTEAHELLQLAEERIRLELIERAASEGLTPDEIQFAMAIERNRRADQEAEAIRREGGA